MDTIRTLRPQDQLSRIQWFLDFVQSDFPNLRENERKKWSMELDIMTGTLPHVANKPNRCLDPEYVAHVWRTLRARLETLRNGQAWSETVQAKVTIHQEAGIVKTVTELHPLSSSKPSTKPAHKLEAELAVLIAELAGSLGMCANSSCNRFFIKRKRQAYCSIRCRDTVNKRAYRKRKRKK